MAEGQHNPSYVGSWTDDAGQVWWRKGKRRDRLPEQRIRTLLRRDGVPLVVWQAFETVRYEEAAAKAAAGLDLRASSSRDDDVIASEWFAGDGRRLLMLEHHC